MIRTGSQSRSDKAVLFFKSDLVGLGGTGLKIRRLQEWFWRENAVWMQRLTLRTLRCFVPFFIPLLPSFCRFSYSIAVNPVRFSQHEHLLRRFHFGKLTCVFVQIENQRRNVVGWHLQIPVARTPPYPNQTIERLLRLSNSN